MDWTQTLTIIGTLLAGAAWFELRHRQDIVLLDAKHDQAIAKQDAAIAKIENNHREDMKEINKMWSSMFRYLDNKIDQIKTTQD